MMADTTAAAAAAYINRIPLSSLNREPMARPNGPQRSRSGQLQSVQPALGQRLQCYSAHNPLTNLAHAKRLKAPVVVSYAVPFGSPRPLHLWPHGKPRPVHPYRLQVMGHRAEPYAA